MPAKRAGLPFHIVDVFAVEPLTGNPLAVVLPVTISQTGGRLAHVVMQQEAPVAGRRVEDLVALASSLGLTAADIAVDRAPCQVMFTGAAHLMVPIRDRDAVDRIQPNAKALLAVLQSADAEGCYVFSMDPRHVEAAVYTRFFNPTVGIWEDPATGTAAGPLAAHLVAHRLATPGQTIVIEQGTAMGRTSLIQVEVIADSVKVSGRGVVVASGLLTL
jgi:trans-2,3-dihydro-3-hydroxyanthranilate isomerase